MDQQEATERFHRLVWPQRARVLRLAMLLTRDPTEAEDLAQETLIKAFRAIEQFEPGTDVKAWLATILRNTRIDRIRSQSAHNRDISLEQLSAEPQDTHPIAEDPDAWSEPEEILQAFSDAQVIGALRQLPEEIRWTLMLVDVERMDHADAAKVLEVPVGTVKSRTHRGRAMLRQALLPLARELRFIR